MLKCLDTFQALEQAADGGTLALTAFTVNSGVKDHFYHNMTPTISFMGLQTLPVCTVGPFTGATGPR